MYSIAIYNYEAVEWMVDGDEVGGIFDQFDHPSEYIPNLVFILTPFPNVFFLFGLTLRGME